jgi:hypothetical protein
MATKTAVGFPGDDWSWIRKALIIVVAAAAVGFVPNKYGKMAGAALAFSQLF